MKPANSLLSGLGTTIFTIMSALATAHGANNLGQGFPGTAGPDDMLDAARIDGASELRIYWSVVVPGVLPLLSTLAIWTFLATWHDFMWPLLVLSEGAH